MSYLRSILRFCVHHRFASSQKESKSKKYSTTILLPKTDFPPWINSEERIPLDKKIEANNDFDTLYAWQRNNVKGSEFVLQDGPPCANGPAHVGHAVNKVIKDIILRHNLLNGYKVHFKPGWDCHGIPIVLKAVSDERNELTPLEIRQKARAFATAVIEEQKRMFRKLGILADWEKECYYTHEESSSISSLKYKSLFLNKKLLSFIPSSHERSNKGTGLVHISPCHGHEDYTLGLKHKLDLKCLVDDTGRFTSDAPHNLEGLEVLSDGNTAVIEKLGEKILHLRDIVHKYPYYVRTKEPVIIRSSEQWFMNISPIQSAAQKSLENVQIEPIHHLKRLAQILKNRTDWCISKRSEWGVPIPVLIDTASNKPIINRELINHYCDLIDQHGTDFWWKLSVPELLPKNSELLQNEQIVKEKYVLDLWFDSSVAWSSVLDADQVADLYVEGVDQFRGFFQFSLLSSVAIRNMAPYKGIFVHGFTVDENGRKMSKSLGNIIATSRIIEGNEKQSPSGIDVFRWWVAGHAVQHHNIPVTERTLKDAKESMKKLRLMMKFLLGNLESHIPDIDHNMSFILDQYMLHQLFELFTKVQKLHEKMIFQKICATILDFISKDISGFYIPASKDRLYCDAENSVYRKDCQVVCFHILNVILRTIAPVVPHLAEEVFSYHPAYTDRVPYFRSPPFMLPEHWNNPSVIPIMNSVLKIREFIQNNKVKTISSVQLSVHILAGEKIVDHLKSFNPTELADILQVASVTYNVSPVETEFSLDMSESKKKPCERCRKYVCSFDEELCNRCSEIVNRCSEIHT